MVQTDADVCSGGRWFPGTERGIGFTGDGHFVVSVFTTLPAECRGTYFTTVPLSPREYRAKHGQGKSGFKRADPGTLVVYDDWGSPHEFRGDAAFIAALADECTANELRERAKEQQA